VGVPFACVGYLILEEHLCWYCWNTPMLPLAVLSTAILLAVGTRELFQQ
jgi:hypothetical protein